MVAKCLPAIPGITPYYQDDWATIYHGDCLEILPQMDDNSVDLVLTDPPYGVGMNSHVDSLSTAIQGLNNAGGKKAIAFCSPRRILEFANGVDAWDFQRLLWWNKSADLSFPWRGWYMNSECICVFQRPGALWPKNCKYCSDLYQSGPMPHRPAHPCWKPVPLICSLMNHGLCDDGIVLDPFMGSGPTLEAAKHLNRRAIGIEIEEKYCEVAAQRLQQEVFDFTPPPTGEPGPARGSPR